MLVYPFVLSRRCRRAVLLVAPLGLLPCSIGDAQVILPVPSGKPLDIQADADPILSLGRTVGPATAFSQAIVAAVDRHPSLTEAQAQIETGRALKGQARAALLPSVDVSISSYDVFDRQFSSSGLQNIVERTRPTSQTDGVVSLNQLAFDGGATSERISAANSRIQAAIAGVDDTAGRIALSTIAAWYDVFTYRALVSLAEQYAQDQATRRKDVEERIAQGAAAAADIARVDSAVAAVQTRIANYRRQLANAEARFTALTGHPAPVGITRGPALGAEPASAVAAREAVADMPSVKAAQAQARAARHDARAAQNDTYPTVGLSVIAGRYGVLETRDDFDIRGQISLRARIGGGLQARANQAKAQQSAADARAATVQEEAGRDAEIAWSDVAALNEQIAALQASYLASRRSRDTIAERFRLTRGTLNDLLDANDIYFTSAASYVEALANRDSAHYILLYRTGRLLGALGIQSASEITRP